MYNLNDFYAGLASSFGWHYSIGYSNGFEGLTQAEMGRHLTAVTRTGLQTAGLNGTFQKMETITRIFGNANQNEQWAVSMRESISDHGSTEIMNSGQQQASPPADTNTENQEGFDQSGENQDISSGGKDDKDEETTGTTDDRQWKGTHVVQGDDIQNGRGEVKSEKSASTDNPNPEIPTLTVLTGENENAIAPTFAIGDADANMRLTNVKLLAPDVGEGIGYNISFLDASGNKVAKDIYQFVPQMNRSPKTNYNGIMDVPVDIQLNRGGSIQIDVNLSRYGTFSKGQNYDACWNVQFDYYLKK